MIFDIGGRKIDFGDDNVFKFVFPLSCGKHQILVNTSIETLQDDDLLSCYACGDMLNDIGQLMASTQCGVGALNKISMDVYIQQDDTKYSEVGSCTALACQDHTFVVMFQALFISGMISTYRLEHKKQQESESEE